ncbi:MAG: prolyl oligopeptidase family serine peptidase [Kofleriaceae bacterium]
MSKLGAFAVALVACSSPAKPPTPTAPAVDPEPAKPVAGDTATVKPAAEDPYLWLEEVGADKSLAWARERNKTSQSELEGVPGFAQSRDRIRAILDSKEKTPYVSKQGTQYYNFWRDAQNPKGLLRRTTLAEYKKAKPKWETVLDVDALAAKDKESWVFKGYSCVYPTYDRCLMRLSRGGGDAVVVREFDSKTKTFIEDGFVLPEAKSRVGWKDRDTLYVGTDFGPGSMTKSGYPRIAKEWKRGTKLTDAATVFEGQEGDVSVSAARSWDHGKSIDYVSRAITFFSGELYVRGADGKLTKVDIPIDAGGGFWNGQITVTLRTDWKIGERTWPKGALLAMPGEAFLAGKRDFTMLFEPAANKSLQGTAELKSAIVVNELEDIKNRLYVWSFKAGKWSKAPFGKPGLGTVSVSAVDGDGTSDDYWLTQTDYLTPSTLSLGALGRQPQPLKASPAFFEAKGLQVEQHFAKSKDGTKIPYFQVSRKTIALDGSNPTILYGYGGFEVSLTPGYDAISGSMWDERGGVYVVANIRGGGEYGPAWHQAALGHERQRAYDDFIAVAEDLIARKVTSTPHLGINGGSNGGLLMGVMLTQRPDLFGAIVCSVPLLDMKRYHKLLAGASWMEEYGDPEKPEDWAVLSKYSPYQNVKAGVKYPRTLFTSSTRDDRVHPGHARKMVARMLEQGHDVLYYENIEGGHGGAADNEQTAFMKALQYAFFAKQLGLK